MNVRAKFQCNSVTLAPSARKDSNNTWVTVLSKTWRFDAVTSGSEENKRFFDSTPGGKVELFCVNPEVEFELGKEYYLDFSSVDNP